MRGVLLVVLIACLAMSVDALSTASYEITPDTLSVELELVEFEASTINIENKRQDSLSATIRVVGNFDNVLQVDKSSISIAPGTTENVTVVAFGRNLGSYNGSLLLSGDINERLAVLVEVIEDTQEENVAISLEAEDRIVTPSGKFTVRVILNNLLIEKDVPLNLSYQLAPLQDQNSTVELDSEEVSLNTSTSFLKTIELSDVAVGDYVLTVTGSNTRKSYQARTSFRVVTPFFERGIGGVQIRHVLIALAVMGLLGGGYFYYRRKQASKKRYKTKLDFGQLPKPGPRSVVVGKIAETNKPAYFEIDQLMMHTIVAGSTGGGKSVSAKVLMEEALMKGAGVLVFDPTAQWSGFLRKNEEEKMFKLYPLYGLKKEDARGFNGNVKQILNAREVIDISKYMHKPGEITIFAVNKLDPADIDILVANVVKQVFRANLPEGRQLKLLLVFDEVHRLLPKFGGSGMGFLQIERAAREFRKWGVGIILISQVLTDFAGETKANIANEVQMRTRDEGDLNRIKTKYGDYMLQSLIKAATGTGMYENPSFNRGDPYFISFRPLLHSHAALDDKTLSDYNKYNDIVDDIEYQIEQLEKESVDVFDLRLELKMALDKVKQGNFNMVNIYLESLQPRLVKEWQKLGKEPKKLEKKMVSEEELQGDYEKAKRFREGEAKKNPKAAKTMEAQGPIAKMLRLDNGMTVMTVDELQDIMGALDQETFTKYQSQKLFSEWIKQLKPEVSEQIQNAKTPADLAAILKGPEKKEEKEEKK